MRAFQDFRIFYNQNIFPELAHLERRRRRLIQLLLLSGLLLLLVAALAVYVRIFLLSMLLLIPVGLWIAYLVFRVQVYYEEFKPRIVGLVLDFIDNDINFESALQYKPKGGISKARFLESRIFVGADDYHSEDRIEGQIRETPFEMAEVRALEFSSSRDKLDRVFNGVFLVADFKRLQMRGSLLALPDDYMKYLNRTERAFHRSGGRRVRNNLLPEFETFFNTYATPEVRIQDVLSADFQHELLEFRRKFREMNREKEFYFSIIGDNLYLALTQDKNILEPSIFANTVGFEVVNEFYSDIKIMLDLVKSVDVMN